MSSTRWGRDTHSVALAALGYVQAALELEEQFETLEWHQMSRTSALARRPRLALRWHGRVSTLPYRLVGISASPFIPDKPTVIAQVATRAARLLDLDLTLHPGEITNDDAYIGAGYGALTEESVAALRLAARTEGLLLDPTYTAKALAGLVDHIRRGRIRPHERVLFLHTGGAPSVFLARNEAIADPPPGCPSGLDAVSWGRGLPRYCRRRAPDMSSARRHVGGPVTALEPVRVALLQPVLVLVDPIIEVRDARPDCPCAAQTLQPTS